MSGLLERLFQRILRQISSRASTLEAIGPHGRQWNPATIEPPWFDRPDALDRAIAVARRHGLGNEGGEWLRRWVQDGYFVVDRAVDSAVVSRYAEDFERIWWMQRPIPGLVLSDVTIGGMSHVHITHEQLLAYSESERREAHRISHWRVGEFYQSSKPAEALFRDARLARICGAILDTRAFPHFSLSFSKGSLQRLHQDTCVFHVWPRNALVGVWIAAEHIRPDSGPLEFYPGSHREPLFPAFDNYPQTQRRTAPPEVAAQYDNYVCEVAARYPKQVYLAQPGDALFWHGMLVHGGAPVESPGSTRRSMVIHYMPKGANRGPEIVGPFNW